ncbi:putative receptor-like protein kinase At2g39360, partial [Bidens hawaiensis]|uniref:putative receptor-like protein kinase At2g39360 n=1 Tax=Bidens hawaiensis TaxID=980011 RepID=UPI0040492A78
GEAVELSRFRLSDILLATENFAVLYFIGLDTTGLVYEAELDHFGNNSLLASEEMNNGDSSKKQITVAIKCIISSREGGQGKHEFFEEIEMRTSYKHPNILSLLGFCDEGDEMILVYEHASYTTLDDYLKSVDNMNTFTWTHLVRMCLEIARGLDHLHTHMVNPQRIIHIDIKSDNILLDNNEKVKFGYFVISKLHTAAKDEPEYGTKDEPGRELDIYSFGVVLFDILCGS